MTNVKIWYFKSSDCYWHVYPTTSNNKLKCIDRCVVRVTCNFVKQHEISSSCSCVINKTQSPEPNFLTSEGGQTDKKSDHESFIFHVFEKPF